MPFHIIFLGLLSFVGVLMVAYFGHCDPLLSGRVSKADQVVYLHRHTIPYHCWVGLNKHIKHAFAHMCGEDILIYGFFIFLLNLVCSTQFNNSESKISAN